MWDDNDRLILQSHWRSFAVSIVAAVLSCTMMLAGFAEILISQRPIPPPRTVAVEAILVEPPPPAEPAKPVPIAPILHPAPRKNFASIKPRKAGRASPGRGAAESSTGRHARFLRGRNRHRASHRSQ